MPGFFEAINRLKPVVKKKHTVIIQGQSIEVSLEKKLEIQKAGECNYMIKNGKITLRPRTKTNRTFATLAKAEHGYLFYENDPFWVIEEGNEGYIWQIESE